MRFLNNRDRGEKIKGFQLQTDGHTEKNTQCESCELSYMQGKLRTVAQETTSHIALRYCFKEVREEPGYI